MYERAVLENMNGVGNLHGPAGEDVGEQLENGFKAIGALRIERID